MIVLCRNGLHEMTPENAYLQPGRSRALCRACKRARRPVEIERARHSDYYAANRELRIARFRESRVRRKREAIEAYGGRCVCCAETELAFLTIDHVNGGGNQHRKVIGGGDSMYRWLCRNGYPQDDYQVLCFNCNHGRWINGGTCPHERTQI